MKSAAITIIWLASFENRSQLAAFVDWRYLEDQDTPTCAFSQAAGLGYFDSDFLEAEFAENPAHLPNRINALSFVENFSEQLAEKISRLDISGFNAVITLTGKKDPDGSVNAKLFEFSFPEFPTGNLIPLGTFIYE
jgi:Immunity protein 22